MTGERGAGQNPIAPCGSRVGDRLSGDVRGESHDLCRGGCGVGLQVPQSVQRRCSAEVDYDGQYTASRHTLAKLRNRNQLDFDSELAGGLSDSCREEQVVYYGKQAQWHASSLYGAVAVARAQTHLI